MLFLLWISGQLFDVRLSYRAKCLFDQFDNWGDIVVRLEANRTNFLNQEILDCSLRYKHL